MTRICFPIWLTGGIDRRPVARRRRRKRRHTRVAAGSITGWATVAARTGTVQLHGTPPARRRRDVAASEARVGSEVAARRRLASGDFVCLSSRQWQSQIHSFTTATHDSSPQSRRAPGVVAVVPDCARTAKSVTRMSRARGIKRGLDSRADHASV
jgi:hypothetical protein